MRKIKKKTGCTLYGVQRAKRVINAYEEKAKFFESELDKALLEGVELDHKRKIANAQSGYFSSLLGYLMDYALRSQSIEELNEWKEKFKKFNETQWKKYRRQEEDLKLVDVDINGRRIV